MKKLNTLIVILAVFMTVSIIPKQGKAQYDFMFTQYMWNETAINPAYTGTRDAISFVGLYRNQWVGMEGAPITKSFSINAPVYKGKVGLGINYIKDEIGFTSNDYLNLSYSYRIAFRNSNLSFGLSTSLITQKEYYSQATTTDPGDTQFQIDSPRTIMPNAGFGVYYYSERYYVGFSIPRLIKNELDVKDNFSVINRFDYKYLLYFFTAGAAVPIIDGLRFQPSAMVKIMQAAPPQLDITGHLVIKDMFWVGAGWRSGDAFSFLTTIYVTPHLRLGYSYDYTLSDLSKYSHGTHEICFGYDFSLTANKIVSPRIF